MRRSTVLSLSPSVSVPCQNGSLPDILDCLDHVQFEHGFCQLVESCHLLRVLQRDRAERLSPPVQPGKKFMIFLQPSLMFVSEAEACLSEAPYWRSTLGLAPGPTVGKIFADVILKCL